MLLFWCNQCMQGYNGVENILNIIMILIMRLVFGLVFGSVSDFGGYEEGIVKGSVKYLLMFGQFIFYFNMGQLFVLGLIGGSL